MLLNSFLPMPQSRRAGSRTGEATRALINAGVRAMFWPVRVVKARQQLMQLGALSERELNDIGLTRQDLHNATGLASDADPTEYLARVADERGRHRRYY
jgi:uncharacterized protein YjiS (DUF1127 family)